MLNTSRMPSPLTSPRAGRSPSRKAGSPIPKKFATKDGCPGEVMSNDPLGKRWKMITRGPPRSSGVTTHSARPSWSMSPAATNPPNVKFASPNGSVGASRELLPANAASPPYAAVTVWWPTDRVVVETLTGPDPATALPTAAPSTENVTVPVGVPGAPGVGKIWAVNVTDVPGVDAAGLADSETDVGTCCTTWVSDPEAGLNPLVGLYCIVIWCVPTGSVETVRVAC